MCGSLLLMWLRLDVVGHDQFDGLPGGVSGTTAGFGAGSGAGGGGGGGGGGAAVNVASTVGKRRAGPPRHLLLEGVEPLLVEPQAVGAGAEAEQPDLAGGGRDAFALDRARRQ